MKDKHVLITGHTGFKGAWLTAMLHQMGAKVSGIALDPSASSMFEKAEIKDLLEQDFRLDIREADELKKAVATISPNLVFHMAAQPLVLASYSSPRETYEVNVNGTLNLLEAIAPLDSVEATVIVTTDKVYQQSQSKSGFSEEDQLGSADPYSTSKAMADLLTQSWIKANPEQRIAIARAGNVIGGGDAAPNRLLPDLMRAFETGQVASVRNPSSTRPWQHVLDCLDGYVNLADALSNKKVESGAFNFGPDPKNPLTVETVANLASASWGHGASWTEQVQDLPSESPYLVLNSTKARSTLDWRDKLSPKQAIEWTVDWHQRVSQGTNPLDLVIEQISKHRLI